MDIDQEMRCHCRPVWETPDIAPRFEFGEGGDGDDPLGAVHVR